MDSSVARIALKQTLFAAAALTLVAMFSPLHAQESTYSSGKEAYDKLCGYCHKHEVGVGTSIQGRGLPAAFIIAIARNGLNAMPAFPESHIDDKSLELLTEYVNTLPAAPPPKPKGATP